MKQQSHKNHPQLMTKHKEHNEQRKKERVASQPASQPAQHSLKQQARKCFRSHFQIEKEQTLNSLTSIS